MLQLFAQDPNVNDEHDTQSGDDNNMEKNTSKRAVEEVSVPIKTSELSTKKSRKKMKKSEEEHNLEKLVFGDEADVLENLALAMPQELPKQHEKPGKKPVWEDEDDQDIKTSSILNKKKARHQENYSKHLEERFVNTYGNPKWAQLDQSEKGYDSDDEMLQTSGNLLGQYSSLPSGNIQLTKCTHLNSEDISEKPIRSVEFHPLSQVALTATASGKATIFQVDGKTNSKIQSIQFDQYPISCGHFSANGEEIIVGSQKYPHFFYYHMIQGKIVKVPWDKGLENYSTRRIFVSPDGRFLVICGHYGHIHLLSAKTKEWLGQLKMNGEAVTITFSPSGKFMYSHGTSGEVYIWDMDKRICISKFYDEGCITGTSLAISPNEQYLAAGSDTGIVNIYEINHLDQNNSPKPVKTFLNLTTEVTTLKFNHTSEILIMASNQKDNAVKLAHFPSMTVFSNFPAQNANFDRITSLDISLNSGFLTIANKKGRALLYRVKKYGNY